MDLETIQKEIDEWNNKSEEEKLRIRYDRMSLRSEVLYDAIFEVISLEDQKELFDKCKELKLIRDQCSREEYEIKANLKNRSTHTRSQ